MKMVGSARGSAFVRSVSGESCILLNPHIHIFVFILPLWMYTNAVQNFQRKTKRGSVFLISVGSVRKLSK